MKVTLISYTDSPVKAMCLAVLTMKEKNPLQAFCSRSGKEQMIREILKTRLRGVLEFASFEFMLEGVSRTFTHQLVRHRSFHFSQQSMRFFDASESKFIPPYTPDTSLKEILTTEANYSIKKYSHLSEIGRTEDVRSILPQNIETKIMFGCTFRGLIDLAEVRMCTQSQGEFREIMELVKYEVAGVSPFLASLLIPVCDRTGRCEFQSIYDRPCSKRKG